jgi:hypothetical protein
MADGGGLRVLRPLLGSRKDLTGSRKDLQGSRKDLAGSRRDKKRSRSSLLGFLFDLMGGRSRARGCRLQIDKGFVLNRSCLAWELSRQRSVPPGSHV